MNAIAIGYLEIHLWDRFHGFSVSTVSKPRPVFDDMALVPARACGARVRTHRTRLRSAREGPNVKRTDDGSASDGADRCVTESTAQSGRDDEAEAGLRDRTGCEASCKGTPTPRDTVRSDAPPDVFGHL